MPLGTLFLKGAGLLFIFDFVKFPTLQQRYLTITYQEGFTMFYEKETLHRRGFLGALAAGAAIGIATMGTPFRLAAKAAGMPPASDTSAFETWLNRINGKHRQVFDSPNHRDGLPFAWTRVFLSTNNETGTPDSELSAVLILRHDSIPMAMEDRLWAKYKLGEEFKVMDPETKAPSVRNMWSNPKPGALPFPDMHIEALQTRGVLMGVCDMAMTFYSMKVAKAMNLDAAEVKKDWVAGILPGIQIVPSGVLAVNRTQEKGCTYCFAG
jgi:intracellular sulfur oxidation DsrE/DsrF family protein